MGTLKGWWWILLVFGTLVLCTGCRKEELSVYPEVHILSPSNYQEFEVLDTVMMVVRVDYPGPTVTLKVNLYNESGTAVGQSLLIHHFPTGNLTTLYYIIQNTDLPTGNYRLLAEAIDGKKSSRAGRTIYIRGIDRQLTAVILVEKAGSNVCRLRMFDPELNELKQLIYQGDYTGSDVSSSHQLIFLAGRHFGDLTAYHAATLEVKWYHPIISHPSIPYFTALKVLENKVYAALWEGYQSVWDMNGNRLINTSLVSATYGRQFWLSDKYLVVGATSKNNTSEHWLQVYYQNSGSLHLSVNTDVFPVMFASYSGDQILLFGNDTQQKVQVRVFNPATGILMPVYQPFELPVRKLFAADQVTSRRFALALADGIYFYDLHSNLLPVYTFEGIRVLRYEPISRLIWFISDTHLYVITPAGQLLVQKPIANQLLNLHLLYNR